MSNKDIYIEMATRLATKKAKKCKFNTAKRRKIKC
jgi:hypothetical protein